MLGFDWGQVVQEDTQKDYWVFLSLLGELLTLWTNRAMTWWGLETA